MHLNDRDGVYAITMWDFSWLERRWSGAGYEDWGRALDELAERGYNAVRIDAFPHIIHYRPGETVRLEPCWDQQAWGAPAVVHVNPSEGLIPFIACCAERDITVALSSWFRQDDQKVYERVVTPRVLAQIWIDVLDRVAEAGLLDSLLFVDLCNEWTHAIWAPFYRPAPDERRDWMSETSRRWMRESIALVRAAYPDLAYTFSHTSPLKTAAEAVAELDFLDLLEPHIWMVLGNHEEFYKRVDYNYELFDSKGYKNVAAKAEALYRADPDYWMGLLHEVIDLACEESAQLDRPLVTTECWGIVDYKDGPGLDWGWVKELCHAGTLYAASKGRWKAIATSNFCGPQFHGMWGDIAWHQELTRRIRST